MSYSTFNGWKLRGRVVKHGEKGMFRNEYGDMMFHRNQTKQIVMGVEQITVYRDNYGRFIKRVVQYV
jgi:hypothetical protein